MPSDRHFRAQNDTSCPLIDISLLEDILDDPDYSDAAAILIVPVSEAKPRSVRVNITLPEDMLRKIDMAAGKK